MHRTGSTGGEVAHSPVSPHTPRADRHAAHHGAPEAAAQEDHSPLHTAHGSGTGSQQEVNEATNNATTTTAASSASTPYTSDWPPLLVLVLSCLSVAAAGLGGNAVRFAMENAFTKYPFFAKYDYIVPNSIGSFIMGLCATLLPPETHLPLVYRALCVGFCGSYTTFSTWMVKVMVQNTAGSAFEHLFIGGTMPVAFFLWGRDLGRLLRWCCAELLRCPWESWPTHRRLLRILDLTVFVLLVVAAVLVPVLIQVYIHKGRVRVISTDDIRMVVLAPAGAVVRYLLAFLLNKKDCLSQFPLGTLTANIVGVTLSIIMFNMEVAHPSKVWFVIVQQGISGALTTVSSLVNELVGFYGGGRVLFAYLYAFVTVGVSVFIGGIGRPQIYHRTVA